MSDNEKPPVETGAPAEADKATPEYSAEQTQAYIKQLREENKKYRLKADAIQAQLDEIDKKQREAESERLAKEGQFKTLYEQKRVEAEKLAEQAKQAQLYREEYQKQLDQRIAQIPEVNRTLIPDFGDPIKTSNWLDANWERLGVRPFPKLDAGAGGPSGSSGGGGSADISPEAMEMARKLGISPERARIVFKGK